MVEKYQTLSDSYSALRNQFDSVYAKYDSALEQLDSVKEKYYALLQNDQPVTNPLSTTDSSAFDDTFLVEECDAILARLTCLVDDFEDASKVNDSLALNSIDQDIIAAGLPLVKLQADRYRAYLLDNQSLRQHVLTIKNESGCDYAHSLLDHDAESIVSEIASTIFNCSCTCGLDNRNVAIQYNDITSKYASTIADYVEAISDTISFHDVPDTLQQIIDEHEDHLSMPLLLLSFETYALTFELATEEPEVHCNFSGLTAITTELDDLTAQYLDRESEYESLNGKDVRLPVNYELNRYDTYALFSDSLPVLSSNISDADDLVALDSNFVNSHISARLVISKDELENASDTNTIDELRTADYYTIAFDQQLVQCQFPDQKVTDLEVQNISDDTLPPSNILDTLYATVVFCFNLSMSDVADSATTEIQMSPIELAQSVDTCSSGVLLSTQAIEHVPPIVIVVLLLMFMRHTCLSSGTLSYQEVLSWIKDATDVDVFDNLLLFNNLLCSYHDQFKLPLQSNLLCS
mmetsp:Transcript_22184/g.26674  ORF Transcript_22184/g.26674 Transcript_22184/m.26674 type:complete len:521 (+) Transcript_22184:468-2030(+)